jgi:hypothetical protein
MIHCQESMVNKNTSDREDNGSILLGHKNMLLKLPGRYWHRVTILHLIGEVAFN